MKAGWRLLVLAGLILVLDQVYQRTAYLHYLDEESDMLYRIYEFQDSDVLYFSASSNFSANPEDSDRRRISQFLNACYPSISIGPVDKGALHGGVFAPLVQRIPDTANVQTWVVAMNLRSFGPGWIHSPLETALMKSNVMLAPNPPLINRFMVSLHAYDNLTAEERKQRKKLQWDRDSLPFAPPQHTVTSWCAVNKWPGDQPRRGLADHFIKNFGWVLRDSNPRVADFDAIAAAAREQQAQLIFHILPENLALADSLVGPDLTNLIQQNRDFLMERYRDQAIVVDNLDLVPDEEFIDRDFPTEHYAERGRKRVAVSLAVALEAFYPNALAPDSLRKYAQYDD